MRRIIGTLIGIAIFVAVIWPGYLLGHPIWGPWGPAPTATTNVQATAEARSNELQKQVTDLQNQLEAAKAATPMPQATADTRASELQKQVDDLKKQLEEAKAAIPEAAKDFQAKLDDLQKQLAETRGSDQQIKDLQAQLKQLQEELSKAKAGGPTPGGSAGAAVDGTPDCTKTGVVAWQNDNLVSEVYGEAPIGGLDEPCWVVAQTWTDRGTTERWIFAVRPHSVAWLSGHRGGTGWYFGGTIDDVRTNLNQQAAQLETRDGQMRTTVVILPDEKSNFRLVTRTMGPTGGTSSGTSTTTASTSTGTSGQTGSCSANGATGPAIVEDNPGNVPTVVKLGAGSTYSFATPNQSNCWPITGDLDSAFETHKNKFLAKWPRGKAIEK